MSVHYIKGERSDDLFDERMKFTESFVPPFLGLLFLLIPIVLTILIVFLIYKLKAKQKMQQNGQANVFGREMTNLIIIMFFFDLSFIIRLILDQEYAQPYLKNTQIC